MSEQAKQPVMIEIMPNGNVVGTGGTRVAKVFSRPWDSMLRINPGTCPFCTRQQQLISAHEDIGNGEIWQLIQNARTPFTSFHVMVIPSCCWREHEVRQLGGYDRFVKVLFLLVKAIQDSGCEQTVITVQVGAMAGQNVAHAHYHAHDLIPGDFNTVLDLLADNIALGAEVVSRREPLKRWVKENANREKRVILRKGSLVAASGGLRAGQCFISSTDEVYKVIYYNLNDLAAFVCELVELYNTKFISEQGRPPDYNLLLAFEGQGDFVYGLFTPILNHWGGNDYNALMGGGVVIMPWSHEATAAHLRGETEVK